MHELFLLSKGWKNVQAKFKFNSGMRTLDPCETFNQPQAHQHSM